MLQLLICSTLDPLGVWGSRHSDGRLRLVRILTLRSPFALLSIGGIPCDIPPLCYADNLSLIRREHFSRERSRRLCWAAAMGLLDQLWDDTLAGPRPETGLGKLRKHNTFSFWSASSGKGMQLSAISCQSKWKFCVRCYFGTIGPRSNESKWSDRCMSTLITWPDKMNSRSDPYWNSNWSNAFRRIRAEFDNFMIFLVVQTSDPAVYTINEFACERLLSWRIAFHGLIYLRVDELLRTRVARSILWLVDFVWAFICRVGWNRRYSVLR